MAFSADDFAGLASVASTRLLQELGAVSAPAIATPGTKRLNKSIAAVQVMVDSLALARTGTEQREAAVRVVEQATQQLHHYIKNTAPDCVGCPHPTIKIEEYDDHHSCGKKLRFRAKCDQHVCRHDVMTHVVDYDDPMFLGVADPSTMMLPVKTVTASTAAEMEIKRQNADAYMKNNIVPHFDATVRTKLAQFVKEKPRSPDKPLTGEADAW